MTDLQDRQRLRDMPAEFQTAQAKPIAFRLCRAFEKAELPKTFRKVEHGRLV